MPKVNANGIVINYEIRGDGEPILFIHGSGVSWKFWEPQIEVFSSSYKMIMVDLRGHGESSKEFPNGQYDHHIIAEDMKHFLDAIGEKKVHVVGVSQGAQIGTLLAINHPEYVDKLVISNSYSEMPTQAAQWILDVSNFIFSLLPVSLIKYLTMSVYKNDPYTKNILLNTWSIDKKMLLAMKKAPFPTHTHLLHKITVPALVMGGAGKVVGVDEGKGSRNIYEHTPNAVLALFTGAFDPLSTMRKDIFNEMIIDFLKGNKLKHYENVTYSAKH